MKVELVVIEKLYAIRRTRRVFFGLLQEITFLNLHVTSGQEWEKRDYIYFNQCLTDDLDKAKLKLAYHGSDLGAPYKPGVVPMDELMGMSELAETDDGMKDLLQQAREFYLLKKK